MSGGSPALEAEIQRMTKLAQEAIDAQRAQAAQFEEVRFSLHKISTTQDAIAEKLVDGKDKMQNHEIRLQALEIDRHTVKAFFEALRLLGQAAWAGVVFLGLGLFALAGYFFKYFGHAT